MRNYREEVKIDLSRLEENLKDQADFYLHWAEKHINAVHERDQHKRKIELRKAQLDKEIREDWEDHFKKEPTEPAIKAWIERHEEIEILNQEMLEIRRKVGAYSRAEIAFEQRKASLQGLVKTWIAGYWAVKVVSEKEKEQLGAIKKEEYQKMANNNTKLRRRLQKGEDK